MAATIIVLELEKHVARFQKEFEPIVALVMYLPKKVEEHKKGAGRKKASGRKNERHEEVQEDDMTLSLLSAEV